MSRRHFTFLSSRVDDFVREFRSKKNLPGRSNSRSLCAQQSRRNVASENWCAQQSAADCWIRRSHFPPHSLDKAQHYNQRYEQSSPTSNAPSNFPFLAIATTAPRESPIQSASAKRLPRSYLLSRLMGPRASHESCLGNFSLG